VLRVIVYERLYEGMTESLVW